MTFLLVLIFCNKFYSLEAHVFSNESKNAKIINTEKSNFWFTDFEVLASLGPPEFRCASVDDLGDVVLSWIPVNDPLGIFIEYRIYSAIGGVYSLIGTESNVSTSSFTHLGANANSASVTYYISAVSNSSGSIVEDSSIDTLSTLFLNVVFQRILWGRSPCTRLQFSFLDRFHREGDRAGASLGMLQYLIRFH